MKNFALSIQTTYKSKISTNSKTNRADVVRRAFRQKAAAIHPDRSEMTALQLDTLEVLRAARDEILRGVGEPLALALPEWIESDEAQPIVIVSYLAFMFAIAMSIYFVGKWLGHER